VLLPFNLLLLLLLPGSYVVLPPAKQLPRVPAVATDLALISADVAEHEVLRLGVLLQVLNSLKGLGLDTWTTE
jgi:hypothetical protein